MSLMESYAAQVAKVAEWYIKAPCGSKEDQETERQKLVVQTIEVISRVAARKMVKTQIQKKCNEYQWVMFVEEVLTWKDLPKDWRDLLIDTEAHVASIASGTVSLYSRLC